MSKITPFNYIVLIILSLGCAQLGYTQEQNANWYFGTQAAINFNDGTLPPTVLLNSAMTTDGTSASVSDSSGNLLFYTNGLNVWNSNHQIMTNGEDLFGNPDISQSVLIVPFPDDTNKYYILSNRGNEMGLSGLYYSVVDMSLNGGLGDVDVSEKNILLSENYVKNMTLSLNTTDGSFWVVLFGYGNDSVRNDTFSSYKIDATGINFSNQATFSFALEESRDNTDGQLKVSPDGQSLALTNNTVTEGMSGGFDEAQSLFTFDFDNTTGVVSQMNDSILIPDNLYSFGIEFSPDSNLLYVTTTNKFSDESPVGRIHQLEYKSAMSIPTLIYEDVNPIYGLQLAIDGKIYSVNFTGFLGTINDPNTVGIGANYVHQNVDLLGNETSKELPQQIPFIPVKNLLVVYNTSFANDTITRLKAKESGVVVFGTIGADNQDNLPGEGTGFIAEYGSDNALLNAEIQQIPYQNQLELDENTFSWDTLPTSTSLNGEVNNNYTLRKFNTINELEFEVITTNINEELIEDLTSEQTYLLFPTSSYEDYSVTGASGRTWTKSATQIFAQDSTVFTKAYNLARFDNSGTLINVTELLNYKWARDGSGGTGEVTFPAKIIGDDDMLYFTVTLRDYTIYTESTKIYLNNGDFHKKGEWLISYDVRNNVYQQSKLIGQSGSLIPNELIYAQSNLFRKRKNDIYKLDVNLNEIDSISFTKLEVLETNTNDGTLLVRGDNNRTIKKIDADFNEIWTKSLGRKFTITNASEAPNGTVYISGSYTENAKFDNPETIDIDHNFGTDTFIAKVDGLPIPGEDAKVAQSTIENRYNRAGTTLIIEDNFTTYPNPFKNELSITSKSGTIYSFEVYDQAGRLIYVKPLKKEVQRTHHLNTTTFKPGIYYVTIKDVNSKIIAKKLMKI